MKNLKKIFEYLREFPGSVAAYFGLNILSSLFGLVSLALLSPFLMLLFKINDKVLGDLNAGANSFNPLEKLKIWLAKLTLTPDGSVKALLIICVIVAAAVFLKNLFGYLSVYVLLPMRNRLINNLRERMYRKVLNLPVGYFTEQRKGEVISKMSTDLNEVESTISTVFDVLLKEPVTVLFYFGYLFYLSPKLTFFLLLFLPVAGLILGRIGRTLKKKNTKVMEQYGIIFSTIEETLGGLRVIKGFNAEPKMDKRFIAENEVAYETKTKANRIRELASPVSETLGVMAVLCVLYYGGRIVLQNDSAFSLNAGDFLTYIAIFSQLISPLKAISSASYSFQKGAASIERVEELLAEPEKIIELPNAIDLDTFSDSIEFRNVGFAYKDKPVLKNINLKIPKGKTVALVGSSGSGKSTLADLVPRFIDVTEGELLIDGKNIKEYSIKSIRNQMGIVTQEAILFNDTIANNIALGADSLQMDKIEQAAKIGNAHNYIINKEGGYETTIGDRGSKLSGGERQRLTIARAVLKNPPILILDEATSALDTESEKLVQEAINNLMQNRTSLVIAHRLSTIRHADEIVVMQHGEIVERGNHETLIAYNGVYKKLVDMQEVA